MKVGNWKQVFLIVILTFAGYSAANAVTFGVGDFYVNVGDYDYMPYGYAVNPGYQAPQVNFYDMMGQYGSWVSLNPFGQVWRPYATNGWRPYTYGHWDYTQYGPTWQGYEPWAWAGYHYGNWAFTPNYGWIWVPGNEWHNGRVAWAQGYDSIGWTPMPPNGYDYSRGYLSYTGPVNQYSYADNDFGISFGIGGGGYSYGGPYYDPRYRDLYYNQPYSNINSNLWTFINSSNFGNDNYADYYLGPEYTRTVFETRVVRISNRQPDLPALERIVRQRIQEVPVEEKQIQTDKGAVKVVVSKDPQEIERIRKHGKEVVDEVIAPAFAEKQKTFKGEQSKTKGDVNKIFRQENTPPRVENLSSEEVINRARQSKANRDQQRAQRAETATQEIQKVEKEGKIRGPKNEAPKDKGRPQDITPGQPKQPNINDNQDNRPADQQKPADKNQRKPRYEPSQPLDQPADQPDRGPKDNRKIDDLDKDKDRLDSEPAQKDPNPEAEESTKDNSSDQSDKDNEKDSNTKKKAKKNTDKKKKPNPNEDEDIPQ
jgi:hypothetical protein